MLDRQCHRFDTGIVRVVGNMKAKLGAHGEHLGVLRQHLAPHHFEILMLGEFKHALHQEPADSMALEPRAHQNGKFGEPANSVRRKRLRRALYDLVLRSTVKPAATNGGNL